MKIKSEIEKYAVGAAENFFLSDVDEFIPWEPFESYDKEWIEEHIQMLSEQFEIAMKWAQERGNK
jgi:hypothetical protein